jgi:ketosteroid isomerase-like protein
MRPPTPRRTFGSGDRMLYLLRPPQSFPGYQRQLRTPMPAPRTSNAERADALVRALHASVEADVKALRAVCTSDVKVFAPELAASSIDDLVGDIARRDVAFGEFSLDVVPLDVGGAQAGAEWVVTMTHRAGVRLAGRDVEGTGARVTVYGATIAQFREERISALRQYWDETSLLLQLGVGV